MGWLTVRSPSAVARLHAELESTANGLLYEARANMPVSRGELSASTRVERKANGQPYITARPPAPGGQTVLRTASGRTARTLNGSTPHHDPGHPDTVTWKCGEPLPAPILAIGPFNDPDSPIAQMVAKHAREALNGGHDWQEVDLTSTGEVVAWYCRRCDEQKYAEGW